MERPNLLTDDYVLIFNPHNKKDSVVQALQSIPHSFKPALDEGQIYSQWIVIEENLSAVAILRFMDFMRDKPEYWVMPDIKTIWVKFKNDLKDSYRLTDN